MLVRRALGDGVTEAEVEKGLDYFLSYYRAHMLDNTVGYPGVREALADLAEDSAKAPEHAARAMAVLTNKPVVFSRAILEGLGLARYFRFVYGGNSFERKKPDPMGVEVLLRDLRASPREALMIGDSDVDIKTARNAGIYACGVSYGFRLEGLRAHPPDLMVDSLTELPGHLDGRGVVVLWDDEGKSRIRSADSLNLPLASSQGKREWLCNSSRGKAKSTAKSGCATPSIGHRGKEVAVPSKASCD